MKIVTIAWSVTLLVLLACAGVGVAAEDMGLITGGDKGTYYQFGLDLQKLVKPAGINLTVHPSKGSIENIYAVYQRPGVPMGIVQSDVLAFVSRVQSDPVLQRIARRSEEHTSELQSPCNLVCRLLLEKKKKNNNEAMSLI